MKKRRCPTCNKILYYKTNSLYNRAIKNGMGCRSCGQKYTKISNGYKSTWSKGLTKEDNPKLANSRFSEMNRNRLGKSYEEIYGKEKSKEIRQKQSSRDNWPNYNKKSIKLIDEFGREKGYDFQHAENGGEVMVISKQGNAYYVDGYDKKNNVVVEYYEKFHTRQKEYDTIRQNEITERMGCEFNIIWE
jgi:DNA-directed RNA polymerase subunit M/transcription elongation factor TFIIS